MSRRWMFLILLFTVVSIKMYSQDGFFDNATDRRIVYSTELSGAIDINTSGIGGIFRQSRVKNAFKSNFYEIGFTTYRDSKEEWYPALYQGYRRYKFGKLNSIWMIRGGIGSVYTLTQKPYWGGVEIQLAYSAGVTVAFAMPVYLYVVSVDSIGIGEYKYIETLEKYNPDKHSDVNILGRGPLFHGLFESSLYPGIYGKFSFSFEYGEYTNVVKSMELGMVIDYFPVGVPVMAYNDPKNIFFSFNLSIFFGKRYNK